MSSLFSVICIIVGVLLVVFGPIPSDIQYLNQGLGLLLIVGGPIVGRKIG